MKKYEEILNKKLEAILYELYHNPMDLGIVGINRKVLTAEKQNIDYLQELGLITDLKTAGGGNYGIQLERKGFEVFEKYNGWYDYKNRVIDEESKVENAKKLAVKYWWISIVISSLALILSVFALFTKTK